MLRRMRPVYLLLLSALCLMAACTSSNESQEPEMGAPYTGPLPPVTILPPPANNPACRSGDPLAHVYHPQRLQVIQRCALVTGVVTTIRHEADKDYHINVKLDPPYANLINERNRLAQGGALVVEIVPFDQRTLKLPRVGNHVEIVGPYVLDKIHGWTEIHPVWALRVL